jgi:redox-sensing transcriptional repressor
MNDLQKIISEKQISVAILTVPPDYAAKVSEALVFSGIKGILNYTSVPVNVPSNIVLENYDMITSLEKVAYYVKQKMGDDSKVYYEE